MDGIDYKYWQREQTVCGIDEVGRGPLAGPVTVAAVILPPFVEIPGLDDSKKISQKERERLDRIIKNLALGWHIVSIPPFIIDEINILQATLMGMREAVKGLSWEADYFLIDGRDYPLNEKEGEAVIGGDSKSQNIAAASIIAKVARDSLMRDYHEIYPRYHFDRHKGYGTPLHREMILSHGPCEIHRRSFLRKMLK